MNLLTNAALSTSGFKTLIKGVVWVSVLLLSHQSVAQNALVIKTVQQAAISKDHALFSSMEAVTRLQGYPTGQASGGSYKCTVWRVGPRHFATAGHCLSLGNAKLKLIIEGGFQDFKIEKIMGVDSLPHRDYGLIVLEDRARHVQGRMLQLKAAEDQDLKDFSLIYPFQQISTCSVEHTNRLLGIISYGCNSWSGISGAPLVKISNGITYAIGMNTRGFKDGGPGAGIRMTKALVWQFNKWISESP